MDNSTLRSPLECELYGCYNRPNPHTITVAFPQDGPGVVVESGVGQTVTAVLKVCDYHLEMLSIPGQYSIGPTYTGAIEARPIPAVPTS